MIKAIEDRRSVRKYKNEAISPEVVENILNAARLAPSWANEQCVSWVVVTREDLKAKLSDSSQAVHGVTNPSKKALATAPAVLVAYADPARSGRWNNMDYYLVDAGIAMAHAALAAADLGLGTCIVGAFDENMVKEALQIPENCRVVLMTPLGRPEYVPASRPRRDLGEIVKCL